jgi:hypothetical protein
LDPITGRLEEVVERGGQLLGAEGLGDTLNAGSGFGYVPASVARAEGKGYGVVDQVIGAHLHGIAVMLHIRRLPA